MMRRDQVDYIGGGDATMVLLLSHLLSLLKGARKPAHPSPRLADPQKN